MNTTSIFFNHSFDKKKLKTFIYWVLKTFGEKEALTMVEELKRMGFSNATKAGLSIGLHDLKTPLKKTSLISRAQITMNKTDQDFQGAELTATERSQRIIDTWHRTSEDLRKQVVDYFSTYDQLNSVYMMALSGARGNFSQVRQLIGMRGLMADPQGQIISFPIRSNLREGLTLTEYFISCSGARKGLVDTALRTADTGYLTRRLVDISHHIVIKKVTCYTSRGIALKTLRTSQKVLLSLKDRLVGRVLGETIYDDSAIKTDKTMPSFAKTTQTWLSPISKQGLGKKVESRQLIAKKNQEISPDLAFKISLIKETGRAFLPSGEKKDVWSTPSVLVRSPLTCTYTHEVCQLCYGWSMAQGSLVSLGEAVGVIAGQSIGEPGTQLTMRTFHTGGVFSGDLLQEIRAPHSGKISFPKALQGLLIRNSQGKIAFLTKVSGELLIESNDSDQKVEVSQSKALDAQAKLLQKHSFYTQDKQRQEPAGVSGFFAKAWHNTKINEKETRKSTKLLLEPSTILFVRQGEKVKSNQVLAELAMTSEEGNQPIQSRQTLFSERRGRVIQWKSMLSKKHREKGTAKRKIQSFDENQQTLSPSRLQFGKTQVAITGTHLQKKLGVQAYLGTVEGIPSFFGTTNLLYSDLDTVNSHKQSSFIELLPPVTTGVHHYEEMWGDVKSYTLKQIVLSKKHGLGAIEPPKALELGLLSVIAIQIGASEKTCTKGIIRSKLKFEQVLSDLLPKRKNSPPFQSPRFSFFPKKKLLLEQSKKKRFPDSTARLIGLQHLNTIAEEGDLVDENYTQV